MVDHRFILEYKVECANLGPVCQINSRKFFFSFFEPAWYFVNENGDDVIIPDEFGSCEKRLTHLMDSFGFSNGDEIVHYYYRIVDEILEFTDVDKSWSLSFDEWRDTQAIVAASFSLVILEAFDADENGLIDSAVR